MRQHILACPGASQAQRAHVQAMIDAKGAEQQQQSRTPPRHNSGSELTQSQNTAASGRQKPLERPRNRNARSQAATTANATSSRLDAHTRLPREELASSEAAETQTVDSTYKNKNLNINPLASAFMYSLSPAMSTTTTTAAAPQKSPITCHVLDTVAGKPAQGISCRLDRMTTTDSVTYFTTLSSSSTNNDGRCLDLLPAGTRAEAGTYKITFFSQPYFQAQGSKSFFPFVEVTFELEEPEAHYHIPLLLSPFSYTTYRGS